ncbi:aminotransferase class I/II-fold pyridoxal phosphate-dependent enzyme [Pseudalkalibacillus decolorationis]|uniref:aminotransferase class I/II-fold pyridoxal phosphate-dependent enzyme n=1 Tax=Pseudalkalibacillus decolorationis TaxID=163879 RepID=UPI0021489396|nr:aminotransferase class I/II-fold pyridoxal phosphate-dependent enzyme [Pseudalkalibacillus decolorationis]
MKLDDFKLEVYFNKYEFTAPYLLCQSDCQSMTIQDLLDFESGTEEDFKKSWLGYTEVEGSSELRQEIAKLHSSIDPDSILVHVGAQEAIFNYMNVTLNPDDHVICQFPVYQSLYEVAKTIGCEVSKWELKQGSEGWEVDIDELRSLVKSNTKLIVVNTPNNPTGYMLNLDEMKAITEIARKNNSYIFSDEVYKGLELDGDTLPWFSDLYENAVSLGVMSKAYGLSGLRIGWISTQNKKIYDKMVRFKHYTSICSSAPSEFLAVVALRNGEKILKRNQMIIKNNLKIADEFFNRYSHLFENNKPKSGPIAFHKLKMNQSADVFCEDLVNKKGVLLLPANTYDYEHDYIRMGYGRDNFVESLGKLEEYLIENGLEVELSSNKK